VNTVVTCILNLLLLSAISCNSSTMKDGITEHNAGRDSVSLVDYLEDSSSTLTIEDVINCESNWTRYRNDTGTSNFGYTSSTFWFRIRITPTADIRNLFVEIGYPMLDELCFYWQESGKWDEVITGSDYPFHTRPFDHEHFVFRVPVSGKAITCYLRVRTGSAVHVPIGVIDELTYQRNNVDYHNGISFFYGILLAILMYNLIILFLVRDREYVFYVLFLGSLILMLGTFDSVAFRYLWPETPSISNQFFWIFMVDIFVLLFTRNYFPRLKANVLFYNVYNIMIILCGLMALTSYYYTMMAMHATLATLVTGIITIASILYIIVKREEHITIFAISWMIFMSAAMIRGMMGAGVLSFTPENELFFRGAVVAQAILFSVALAGRINKMKNKMEREIELRKKSQLDVENKNIELGQVNEELQSTIEELEATNEVCSTQNEELETSYHLLRESEEKFRTYTECAPMGLMIYNEDSRWTYANQVASGVTGFSSEELCGMYIWEIFHHDYSEMIRERGNSRIRGLNPPQNYTAKIVHRHEGEKWVKLFTQPIVHEGKKSVLVSILDVTREIEAEENLRNSEDRFHKAFKNSPAIIGIARLEDGIMVEVNNSFERITEFNRDEVIGKSPVEIGLVNAHDQELILRRIEKEKAVYGIRGVYYTKYGLKRKGILSCEIINVNNTPCVISVFDDITDLLRAEEALREEHERLEVTLKSIQDAVIATNIENEIILMNDSAEQITGWNRADCMGMQLNRVLTIYDSSTKNGIYNSPGEDNRYSSFNSTFKNRNGDLLFIGYSSSPIHDRDNTVIGRVIVFRDVTDNIRIQEELLKIQKIESVGVLAAGIAHDFNNMLSVVIGNTALAKMDETINADLSEILDEIEIAARYASKVTAQLLSFSKGWSPVKEWSSIAELLQEYISFSLRGSNVRYKLDLVTDLWPVNIDRAQVGQVLQNIIINADQAMCDGGEIVVTCTNEIVESVNNQHSLVPGKYISISISDTGPGIEPDVLPRIFDPFFTTKEKGNGLGLSTAYGIIQKHNGIIDVTSEPGKGTRFTIFLPAEPDLEIAGEDLVADDESFHGKSVLVMDDDDGLLKVLGMMLSSMGLKVYRAHDGEEAITMFKDMLAKGIQLDIVILDLTIPGSIGGAQVIRELNSMSAELSSIVMSGYSESTVLSNYTDHGFSGRLLKPFTIDELRKEIRQIMAYRVQ